MRVYVSGGTGNSNIVSISSPVLYVYCVLRDITPSYYSGVKDYSVHKTNLFQHTPKTNNYLQYSIMANIAKQRGGHLGVIINEHGHIVECSVACVGFVFEGDKFVVTDAQEKI